MSSVASSKTPFQIEIIKENDKNRIAEFLNQQYFGHGPISEYLNRGVKPEFIVQEAEHDSIDIIDEGLSVMAVSPSGEVVGVALNKTFSESEDTPESSVGWNENTMKVLNLLERLREEAISIGKFSTLVGKRMVASILAVHSEWRHKGIASALWKFTRELAERNSFSYIQSTCSSAYSARILENFGFECIHAISYEDYKEDGKVIIKPDSPHTHIKIMLLKL